MSGDRGVVAPDVMAARVTYDVPGLGEDEVTPDPLAQFRIWFEQAAGSGIGEPNAMALATCGPQGPAVRILLAKGVDARGVSFFTNLRSDKAREIEHDPRVSCVFAWIPQHRQVRFTGTAELLTPEEVEEYFASRPRGAQLGAWASRQSQPLRSRADLAVAVEEVTARFEGEEVTVPEFWGGYRIRPTAVEFWQGQPSRLHDRLRYEAVAPAALLDEPDSWRLVRLWP